MKFLFLSWRGFQAEPRVVGGAMERSPGALIGGAPPCDSAVTGIFEFL